MDRNYFQHACLKAHVYALKYHEGDYLEELDQKMDSLTSAVKGCALAALHLAGNHKALNKTISNWDIANLYKMFVLLDARREANQLAQKIQSIECQHPHLLTAVEDVSLEENKPKQSKKRKSKKRKTDNSTADAPVEKRKRRRKIDAFRKKYKELRTELDGHACTACGPIKDDSVVLELIASASVSGSLARKVRTVWAPILRADFLEFVMLEMPKKTIWKYVADLVHFKPSDFSVPYFLADVHGESIPEDSFVYVMRQLMDAKEEDLVSRFCDVAKKFPQVYKSYAFLRTKSKLMGSKEIVELLAENIPVGRAIWYFEELYGVSNKVALILEKRLEHKDFLTTAASTDAEKVFKYGKLLERILTFQKLKCTKLASLLTEVATCRLGLLKESYIDTTNKKKVAVFADASASMQTAIDAAAIIASIVSTCLEGELSFFNRGLVKSPHEKPSTVQETLEICSKIRANNNTSLAASLYPYFEQKKVIDTIVMVTDEGENASTNGFFFAPLLKKYKETVNPNVVLVIVRVGSGDTYFRQSLVNNGIEATTVVIDNYRPDLTKFDSLLGEIALIANRSAEAMELDAESSEGDFVVVE